MNMKLNYFRQKQKKLYIKFYQKKHNLGVHNLGIKRKDGTF